MSTVKKKRTGAKSKPRAARKEQSEVFVRLARCVGHEGPIRSVDWSPDGTKLATGSADGTVRLWDATTGQAVKTVAEVKLEGERPSLSVAWSPAGAALAIASPSRLTIVDIDSGQVTRRHSLGMYLHSRASWSRDGRHLVVPAATGLLVVAVERAVAQLSPPRGKVTTATWSPDGQHLAVGMQRGKVGIYRASNLARSIAVFASSAANIYAAC